MLELDTGYLCSPQDPGRALHFLLHPRVTGEASLVFRILEITNPIKLHGRITYRERPYWKGGKVTDLRFVIPLEKGR
jgi:hypothetical protein